MSIAFDLGRTDLEDVEEQVVIHMERSKHGKEFHGIRRDNTLALIWAQGACSDAIETFDNSPRAAKRICKTCPVQQECLEYALTTQQYGVWGGTTVEERRALR